VLQAVKGHSLRDRGKIVLLQECPQFPCELCYAASVGIAIFAVQAAKGDQALLFIIHGQGFTAFFATFRWR
jgi:hypothetical protein